MRFCFATGDDAELLAQLNAQLIRDEGHRNSMTVLELAQRMKQWLSNDYRAVLFEDADTVIGYALFRHEPEFVYLRQLFVQAEYRRRGVGRAAIEWLRHNAWGSETRVRIDVLIDNVSGQTFWRAIGFRGYCITMEHQPRNAIQALAH
jgi:predicted acetyltransferase